MTSFPSPKSQGSIVVCPRSGEPREDRSGEPEFLSGAGRLMLMVRAGRVRRKRGESAKWRSAPASRRLRGGPRRANTPVHSSSPNILQTVVQPASAARPPRSAPEHRPQGSQLQEITNRRWVLSATTGPVPPADLGATMSRTRGALHRVEPRPRRSGPSAPSPSTHGLAPGESIPLDAPLVGGAGSISGAGRPIGNLASDGEKSLRSRPHLFC